MSLRATFSGFPGARNGDFVEQPSTHGAPDVLAAVGVVLNGRLEQVAKRIGMSPSTLQKKVSQHVTTHHLSVAELQLIQHATGDMLATQVLARAEGYGLVRLNPAEVPSAAEGIADLMDHVGALAKHVAHISAAGRQVSINDARACTQLLGEVLASANALGSFVAAQAAQAQAGREGGGYAG